VITLIKLIMKTWRGSHEQTTDSGN